MKSFITNVHLKNAALPDYDQLDREMEKEQFAKSAHPGTPSAQKGREYNYLGSASIQTVTAAAYRAAHKTGKQYSFTVIRLRS